MPSSYHTPQPGMPTVWMILITTWAMKTKKKAMKLKELSVLRGRNIKICVRPDLDSGERQEQMCTEWTWLTWRPCRWAWTSTHRSKGWRGWAKGRPCQSWWLRPHRTSMPDSQSGSQRVWRYSLVTLQWSKDDMMKHWIWKPLGGNSITRNSPWWNHY